jgi:hypothetical protein
MKENDVASQDTVEALTQDVSATSLEELMIVALGIWGSGAAG